MYMNYTLCPSAFNLIVRGLTQFLTFVQSYHDGQVTYPRVTWIAHTNTPRGSFSKQLSAFQHILLFFHWWKTNHVCRNDFCQTSEEIFCRVGDRDHNPWFDSSCYYLLSYFGLVVCFETFKGNMK